MTGLLRTLSGLNRGLSHLLQGLLIAVFTVLVLVVVWGVVSRYLLGDQASWSEELARLLMVWLALLGAALVCREERHLGLDVVVRAWPEDVQRVARIFAHLCILSFAAAIMAWGGWQLVSQRFAFGQMLPALGISKGWFYLALPVSGALTSVFSIELMLAAILKQTPQHPQEEATS